MPKKKKRKEKEKKKILQIIFGWKRVSRAFLCTCTILGDKVNLGCVQDETKQNKQSNKRRKKLKLKQTKKEMCDDRLKYRQQCCIVTEISGILPNTDKPYKSL